MARSATIVRPTSGTDLLRLPLLGRWLRWKHARTSAQAMLLVLSLLVLYDGFLGPPLAPKNLAGVLPWVHWRGLVVLGLLLVGNVFCFACPFMLPRRLAKRWFHGRRPWPRWLPGKLVAIVTLGLFFWAYEAFSLWASPWLTAWVALAYFVGAFVIDGVFAGAAFCKHVCPIGQFNFVMSLSSPTEVTVRDPAICLQCQTKDCIHGRYDAHGRLLQSGCELWLFQPRKVGNLDCTFCLDCVQACPYDNVGVLVRNPLMREFSGNPVRSGIGRWSQRIDLGALVLLLVFGAFLNAFGMVEPATITVQWLRRITGIDARPTLLAIVFGLGLVVLPVILVGLAAFASRLLTKQAEPLLTVATRFSYALAPLGFGMWLAHYQFHFLTGALTIVPVLQSFVADVAGAPLLGQPRWDLAQLLPLGAITVLKLLFLQLGFLGTIGAIRFVSRDWVGEKQMLRASLPWLVVSVGLLLVGIWLLLLPMDMRGTLMGMGG